MKATRVLLVQGRNATQQWMVPEIANGLLKGELTIKTKDVRITDVLIDTQQTCFAFYPDTVVPQETLRSIGFEPINKERH